MALPIAGAAGFVAAAAAIKGVVDEIKQLPSAVRGFVDALSPQSGERLDVAFRSLHATIGFGLQPVLTTAIGIVQNFANAISSGMNDLRGPIEALTQTFAGVLQPVIATTGVLFDGLARAARALEPLLPLVGTALEGIATLGHVLTAVVTEGFLALMRQIIPSGDLIARATDKLTEAFVGLIESTLRLTDYFLAMIGQEKLMIPILQALARPRDAGRREGAPQGFGMSNLEDLYRRRLVEAARSGGEDPQVRSANLLAELKTIAEAMLKEIQDNNGRRELAREAQAAGGGLGAGGGAAGGGPLAVAINELRQWFERRFGPNNPPR